eukprot:5004874-Ditylum_brightwellii.AAC.1
MEDTQDCYDENVTIMVKWKHICAVAKSIHQVAMLINPTDEDLQYLHIVYKGTMNNIFISIY